MNDDQALFANDTFYLAFAHRDIETMDRLWAKHCPVICVHPGWPAITERDEIINSWKAILENPEQSGIDFYNTVAHSHQAMVFVTCYEEVPGGICIATNAFVTEDDDIKMCVHHSGQCLLPPAPKTAGG